MITSKDVFLDKPKQKGERTMGIVDELNRRRDGLQTLMTDRQLDAIALVATTL